jgi:hypothetical protein
MTAKDETDRQLDDLRDLALVCFLNDTGVVKFLELDERGMAPLFHGAGFTTADNLIDNARCERVMARLYQIHVARREELKGLVRRQTN